MHVYVVLCAGGYQGVVAAVAESDVVVNCAVVRQRRTLAFLVNVRGTFNAIRAAVSPSDLIQSNHVFICVFMRLRQLFTSRSCLLFVCVSF
jgi:nucleoside-diphosphate-sugar epimerase